MWNGGAGRVGRETSGCSADFHRETYMCPKPGQYIDERIRAEQVDAPTKEITDAGLSHTEYLGRGFLLEAAGCDEFLHLNHEVRPDQQMLGFFAAKPEVAEDIPGGRRDFYLHDDSPLPLTLRSALSHECLITLPANVHITLRRFSGPFFEGMKYINGLRKLGDVAYATFHRGMNSDFTDAGTNCRHRLPVGRLQAMLYLSELKACKPSGIPWESLKVTPGRPEPEDWLFDRHSNMQVLVYRCQAPTFFTSGYCARLPSPRSLNARSATRPKRDTLFPLQNQRMEDSNGSIYMGLGGEGKETVLSSEF